ncbi:putative 2-aminoethylphosphonate ABC transporter ATP-binding protein [Hansschlegelia zhihuaiae]|uniref:Putative 2-aminoethylphosphonate ABC transporter ATP-binding protein n=1 Tax=Hansschlegelia zhihuaiae TaxID=405005 RepID=A0A4Q0MIN7_9HYPH|nr:putative 2-aminoethylphosphonate ABC transporter ATP-binding protein [Hansschlegelia zhihuaiae]RXF72806.1 putative 2-aminoethylphosphonate ABC transporter ATP-binding protein [Hansschlegelia zhihuaiae]
MTASEGVANPFLSVRKLNKLFGAFHALKDIDLDVARGEFVCFLGPSGCGKTTLLRAIAGLDPQNSGQITIGGRDVSNAPPSERDFGIVFQSYALFPNLTVAKNVGYGLVNRGRPRAEIAARVAELLALVGLPEQGEKFPGQLSGGQQQRVALARALATSPGLLLLDEPLSALDAKVRVRLRDQIRALQQQLGVTTIMVTHDQEEALAMADRIVVMNHGVIEQIGSPAEIYGAPKTPFVADFVGHMTFLDAVVAGPGRVRVGALEFLVAGDAGHPAGSSVRLAMRPETVRTRSIRDDEPNRFEARIGELAFLGSFCRATLEPTGSAGCRITAEFSANAIRDLAIAEGQVRAVSFPPESLRVFAGFPS